MRTKDAILLLTFAMVGCHKCGRGVPDPGADTDPFAPDDCGFICGAESTGTMITATPLDDTTGPAPQDDDDSDTGRIDACTMSSDCGRGLVCVAPFDQALGPYGKGAYACVADCVPAMNEELWCADASACCDPDAVCTDRGYCVPPELATGTDTGDTGDTDASTTGIDDDATTTGSTGA